MKSNPTAIALGLMALAVVIYFGGLCPLSESLLKKRKQLSEEETRLASVEMNNNQREDFKARIARIEKANEARRATWITPILNSYAMRIKSLVDTMATEAGLVNVEYGEGELLTLPVPKECVPDNRTARRSVRIRAQADYAAAVSFLMRIEKELPLAAVQSLTIQPVKNAEPVRQDVEIVLEWPGKGEVIR